jgi:hypothetical protein
MDTALAAALKQLDLQPGEIRRIAVNGYRVEIRVLPSETSSFADTAMLDLWLDVPSSAQARTIKATRGKSILPAPFELQETDLTPE